MKKAFDTYTRRARLEPALLVALPLGISVLALLPKGIVGWGTLWGLIVWCGGTALIAQIGRDFGKRKQKELFESWGGKPTTYKLRQKGPNKRAIIERYHKKLSKLIPDIKLPTQQQEENDPSAADDLYEICAGFLREKTRDRNKFPLVFEENCNYGFRRNLWGMKPLGIVASLVGLSIVFIFPVLNLVAGKASITPIIVISGVINILFLISWLWIVTPIWVKAAADAYAHQLLSSCENL